MLKDNAVLDFRCLSLTLRYVGSKIREISVTSPRVWSVWSVDVNYVFVFFQLTGQLGQFPLVLWMPRLFSTPKNERHTFKCSMNTMGIWLFEAVLTSLASLPFSLPFLDGALSPGFPPSFCMRSADEIDTYTIHAQHQINQNHWVDIDF